MYYGRRAFIPLRPSPYVWSFMHRCYWCDHHIYVSFACTSFLWLLDTKKLLLTVFSVACYNCSPTTLFAHYASKCTTVAYPECRFFSQVEIKQRPLYARISCNSLFNVMPHRYLFLNMRCELLMVFPTRWMWIWQKSTTCNIAWKRMIEVLNSEKYRVVSKKFDCCLEFSPRTRSTASDTEGAW